VKTINYVLRFAFYVLLFLAIVWLVTPGVAQEPVTDDEVNDVAKDLYCPVCESTPLDTCPTQACADWRELIRTQLSEGQSKEEIYDYFARQYGDGVLAAPPRRGFNLVLWFFPVAAVLVGGFFFSRFLRNLRATGNSPAAVVVDEPEREAYIDRVEQELQER
jgi:cytochrome c-type biogenesis protein CcmH